MVNSKEGFCPGLVGVAVFVAAQAVACSGAPPIPAGGTCSQKGSDVTAAAGELSLPTREVHARCDGAGSPPCANAAFYSAVIARDDGAVIASTMQNDADPGPLEMLRSDGVRCRADVHCDRLTVQSGKIWCTLTPEPFRATGGYVHGKLDAVAELAYSRDLGATWRVVSIPRGNPIWALARTPLAPGDVFLGGEGDDLWVADIAPDETAIRFRPMRLKPPGRSAVLAAFSNEKELCLERYLHDDPFRDRALTCVDRSEIAVDESLHAGAQSRSEPKGPVAWRQFGIGVFLRSVSTSRVWWAVPETGGLLRSTGQPGKWAELEGLKGWKVFHLSRQGDGNGVVVSAEKDGSIYIVRLSEDGRVLSEVAAGAIRVTDVGAEGGPVALGSPDGVFVLEGTSWRQVMPACGAQ